MSLPSAFIVPTALPPARHDARVGLLPLLFVSTTFHLLLMNLGLLGVQLLNICTVVNDILCLLPSIC